MGSPRIRPIGAMTALTAFLALSSLAAAQQPVIPAQERPLTTHPDRPEAVKIWVTGSAIVDYVNRPAQVTVFSASLSNLTGLGSPTSDFENTFEGEIGIRVTAEFLNKMTVVVEFGTRRADGDPSTGGGINRFGEDRSIHPRLREAHIRFTDIFGPEVTIEAGISTWKFNVRGKGGSLAFDPRGSQTITRNLDSDGVLNTRDFVDNRFAEAGGTEPSQPMGGTITYSAGSITIDVVLLPIVTDDLGGGADDDLYAIDLLMGLDSIGVGSRFGLIFAMSRTQTGSINVVPGQAVVFTLGGGTSIMIMKGLEIYGEGYLQAGRTGVLLSNGSRVAASGRAAQIGAEWHYVVANPLPFWFGANFTHITGNESSDPNSKRTSRFAAYESVADLMIIEDPNYGFDWDSNIQGLKVSGGLSLDIASDKPDLDLVLIMGFMKATSAVFVPGGGVSHGLGNEVDFKATWHVTKQFALKASVAFLWNSILLQQAMIGVGNPNAADHAWLAVVGWDLVF